MVDLELSFVKIVTEIKTIVDLTLLNPEKLDKWKMSHIIHYSKPNVLLATPFEADHNWLQVIQYVRTKSKKWESILSDEYISHELHQLIYQLKTDQGKYSQIGRTVKDWIEKLKKSPRINFRFILPVNNVDYRHDFDFGSVKLQKLTLDKLQQIAPFNVDGTVPDFSSKSLFEEIVKTNQTEIFAIIEIQAKDEEQGNNLAHTRLRRFIYAMRLFNPASGITERKEYFPRIGYEPLIVNLDEDSLSTPYSNLHFNTHIWPKEDYWKEIQEYWDQLTIFLYHESPNELETLILNGLFWYGEAGRETETDLSKFLKYIHGLESLVIFDKEFGKKDRFAERLTMIFNKDKDNFEKSKELLKKYYNLRNSTIHAGQFNVDGEDVGTTHSLLRSLLFKYIESSKKYTTVKNMFEKEFSIDTDAKVSKPNNRLLTKILNIFGGKNNK